jgi:hypothetical protein
VTTLPLIALVVHAAESVGQQLPTNWYGLAGLVLIMGIPALVTVGMGRLTQKKVGSVQSTAAAVEEQVTNGGTNLAETVKQVAAGISEIRKDIGGLREEIRHERRERLESNAAIMYLIERDDRPT